jgi:hypothetical protein
MNMNLTSITEQCDSNSRGFLAHRKTSVFNGPRRVKARMRLAPSNQMPG